MFQIFNKLLGNNSYDKGLAKIEGKDYKKFIENTGFNVFISIMIVLSLATLYFISASKKPTEFYLVNTEKKEMKLIKTSSEPIMSPRAIESWNSISLTDIFTFNFTNYNKELKSSAIYFTPSGYDGFYKSLEKSGMLESVRTASLEVTLTPTSKSIITDKRVKGGVMTWNIELTAFISYMGTGATKNEQFYILTEIKKVPTYENPNGIAINKINMIKM